MRQKCYYVFAKILNIRFHGRQLHSKCCNMLFGLKDMKDFSFIQIHSRKRKEHFNSLFKKIILKFLQCCVGSCRTSQINHNYTCTPLLSPHPHSRSSKSSRLGCVNNTCGYSVIDQIPTRGSFLKISCNMEFETVSMNCSHSVTSKPMGLSAL